MHQVRDSVEARYLGVLSLVTAKHDNIRRGVARPRTRRELHGFGFRSLHCVLRTHACFISVLQLYPG